MRKGARAAAGLRGVGALMVLLWAVLPILLLVSASPKSPSDIFADPPQWFSAPTLRDYAALVQRWPDFFGDLLNSLVVTECATVLCLIASLLAGYVYARVQSRVAASATLMLGMRLLPPIVLVLPLSPVVNWLGLNDTRLLLIILYSALFVSLGTVTALRAHDPEAARAAVRLHFRYSTAVAAAMLNAATPDRLREVIRPRRPRPPATAGRPASATQPRHR